MYKQDLALNNLQGLMCHKNQPTSQHLLFSSLFPFLPFTRISSLSPSSSIYFSSLSFFSPFSSILVIKSSEVRDYFIFFSSLFVFSFSFLMFSSSVFSFHFLSYYSLSLLIPLFFCTFFLHFTENSFWKWKFIQIYH